MRKSFAKTIITFTLCASIFLQGKGFYVVDGAEKENNKSIIVEDSLKEDLSMMIPVAAIPVGEGQYIEYCYSKEGFNQGPTDFAVSGDGSISILDSNRQQLIVYDNSTYSRSILLDKVDNPSELIMTNEAVAVKDTCGQVYEVSENGYTNKIKLAECFNVNDDFDTLFNLIDTDNKFVDIIKIDEDGSFYTLEFEYVPDISYILLEKSIHKYDANGNEVGYAIYDTEDCVAYLDEPVKIDDDGNIYLMLCKEEQIMVYQVVLGTGDVSTLNERKEIFLNEKVKEKENDSQIIETRATGDVVSLTPYQVYTRAFAMSSMQWTVSAANKNTSLASGTAILPNYIASASVGSTVTGIPYCWGGFNGYDTVGSGIGNMKFSLACQQSVMTGNVYCVTAGRVGGTVGLDCSGFVGSAYGLTTKPSTTNLATFGYATTWTDIGSMDFFVDSGNHAMLYCSTGPDEYSKNISVFDSSTDMGKVAQRSVSVEYIEGNYEMRTPWR